MLKAMYPMIDGTDKRYYVFRMRNLSSTEMK